MTDETQNPLTDRLRVWYNQADMFANNGSHLTMNAPRNYNLLMLCLDRCCLQILAVLRERTGAILVDELAFIDECEREVVVIECIRAMWDKAGNPCLGFLKQDHEAKDDPETGEAMKRLMVAVKIAINDIENIMNCEGVDIARLTSFVDYHKKLTQMVNAEFKVRDEPQADKATKE